MNYGLGKASIIITNETTEVPWFSGNIDFTKDISEMSETELITKNYIDTIIKCIKDKIEKDKLNNESINELLAHL